MNFKKDEEKGGSCCSAFSCDASDSKGEKFPGPTAIKTFIFCVVVMAAILVAAGSFTKKKPNCPISGISEKSAVPGSSGQKSTPCCPKK